MPKSGRKRPRLRPRRPRRLWNGPRPSFRTRSGLEKNAVLASDEDMATFQVLFQQAQDQANKMRGILLKLRGRADQTAAQGVEKAMRALSEAIGRCAE